MYEFNIFFLQKSPEETLTILQHGCSDKTIKNFRCMNSINACMLDTSVLTMIPVVLALNTNK